MRRSLFLATLISGTFLSSEIVAAEPDQMAADEKLLQAARIATDGPSLLEYFHKQKPASEQLEKIQALIQRLGDRSYEVRENASRKLAAIGFSATPLLRQAVMSPDLEIRRRAETCLQQLGRGLEWLPHLVVVAPMGLQPSAGSGVLFAVLTYQDMREKSLNPAVTSAAAHVLAWRKPHGAAAALLDYLPYAPNEVVAEDIEDALIEVAVHDSLADPAVSAALTDKVSLRRGAAGVALCRAGGVRMIPAVRPLLRDPEPAVRRRAAMALADLREQDAIPVLIALLGQLGPTQAGPVEELLREIAGEQAPTTPLGTTAVSRRECQEAWETWWRAVDSQALLDVFRRRTLADADRDRILALISQLGHDDYFVREQAGTRLIALGPLALPMLRHALKDADPEVVWRAQKCQEIIESSHRSGIPIGVAQVMGLSAAPQGIPAAPIHLRCLQSIEKDIGAPIPAASARLLALRKPPQAADTLLAYLPFSDDEMEMEEIQSALTALALHDDQPASALVRALDDRIPIRRATAAVALCRGGGCGAGATPVAQAVRQLLKDPEPQVRLRVALTLAELKDKTVIPQLIDLLTELPEEFSWPVEDFLRRLAGDRGPAETPGLDEVSRRKARNAWAAWWQKEEARVDLAVLERKPRLLGYTVVAEYTDGQNGRVLELGLDGKPRWKIDSLPWPLEVQVLPGNRLLLAEYYHNRVAERNFKGELLWHKQLNQPPVSIQRLANGNTFIATQTAMIEVDRSGKEVASVARAGILMAQKIRGGRIAFINSGGLFSLLDSSGKELKSFHVGPVQNYCSFQVLPNGGVLVPLNGSNQVAEFSPQGKEIWKARVQRPTCVSRLPNGHTLVACRDFQLVVELDRSGKEVWQYRSSGYPWRAYRR